MDKVKYSVVVPVYFEEEVISECYTRLKEVMDGVGDLYEIVFVNDGSKDKTENMINEICKNDDNIKLINFSRNFGHQIAITAGMDYASGDAIIIIDADLQDPPEIIPDMIKKWKEGYEVVYGKRKKRKGEGAFKLITAKIFYRLLGLLVDIKIPYDTGDFRLIDRSVCDSLRSMKERNRYVRGLISWIGYKQTFVEYDRDRRFAGETKYPLKKMIQFAFNAITSFSHKPVKIASYAGYLLSFASFVYLLIVLYQRLFTDKVVQGWASTIGISLFFNGIVLIVLGIIGEYITRIYDEVKGRPLYIIKNKNNFSENSKGDD
jgi:glycosyltransferase involved in cell wall biosynthesis